jgi:hypothetical protein
MDLQTEKLEILRMILETENPKILYSIKNIFKKQTSVDFWETIPQSQKEDILSGIQEIENGEIEDYESFISNHR